MIATILNALSEAAVPFVVLFVLLAGRARGVDLYDAFIRGAMEGLRTGLRIAPHLVAMLTAVTAFRTSGAMQLLTSVLAPLLTPFGVPAEVVPLGLTRPLSGSAALALLSDILENYGPDSRIGLLASTIMGSTETTLYVITVYLGAVGLTNYRHTLAAGLAADIAGFAAACVSLKLLLT